MSLDFHYICTEMGRGASKIDVIALKILVFGLFAVGMLSRCANAIQLQGGPKDTIPPQVVAMKPGWGATDFEGKRIYIEFDEYLKMKDQQKEFYTSPFMKTTPVITLKGKGIQIDIKDTLQPNTTYSLNFGGSVTDNNEGNVLHDFRYVFSTGPEVDSMFLTGYTVDGYTSDSVSGAYIYFYEASKYRFVPEYDSLLLLFQPDAVGRAKSNGIFIAQNLKPVDYHVYAVEDRNNNFQYDPGDDRVGFMDSLINPLTMPEIMLWYDSTRKYFVADPQLQMRMFTDKKFKRQYLAKQERPQQNKAVLYFNAPWPEIEALTLDGIEDYNVVRQYSRQRDTVTLWLDVRPADLPDTIRGSITYMKNDSVNNMVPSTEKLSLFWKLFETKKEQRQREKEEKDEEAVIVNPFKMTIDATTKLNPEKSIPITFEYPLRGIDSTAVSLIRVSEDNKRYRVKYNFTQDTLDMLRWTLNAPWAADQKYQLEIPSGVFENIRGEVNDTLKTEFTVIAPEKYATIEVNVKGKTPEHKYIVQVVNQSGKVIQERIHVSDGKYTFRYLDPGSNVRIRVIEDVNGNGRWDDGDLIKRQQPERVEIFSPEPGKEEIPLKEGWELSYDIDMERLFAPVSMDAVVEQLRNRELKRVSDMLKQREKDKNKPQRRDNNQNQNQNQNRNQPGGNMGMGGGGMPAMPGLRR